MFNSTHNLIALINSYSNVAVSARKDFINIYTTSLFFFFEGLYDLIH